MRCKRKSNSDDSAAAAVHLAVYADTRATCRFNDLLATCADPPAIATIACLSTRDAVHTDFPAAVDAVSAAIVRAETPATECADRPATECVDYSATITAAHLVVRADVRTILRCPDRVFAVYAACADFSAVVRDEAFAAIRLDVHANVRAAVCAVGFVTSCVDPRGDNIAVVTTAYSIAATADSSAAATAATTAAYPAICVDARAT